MSDILPWSRFEHWHLFPDDIGLSDAYLSASASDTGGRRKVTLAEADDPIFRTMVDALLVKCREAVDQLDLDPESSVDFRIVIGHGNIFRGHLEHTLNGRMFSLRRMSEEVPEIETLNLPDIVRRNICSKSLKNGMVLIAGATGNGKSWTAYSMLRHHVEKMGRYGVDISNPVEFPMKSHYPSGGSCIQIPAKTDDEIPLRLQGALRDFPPRETGVILVGEIRKPVVAIDAVNAAVNGHLVISTIHASSVMDAVHRILGLVGNTEASRSVLSAGLRGVIHQRLDKNKMPHVQMLFVTQSEAAKIRKGDLAQLSSDIERQNMGLARNGG